MIQLEGRLERDRVVLDRSDHAVPVGALDEPPNDGHRVFLGLWPDDLEIAQATAGGYHPATIYAVEFRGIDKAIQIDAGHHALRKVVDVDLRTDQGDPIWFRIPPECCFLFDAATGRRLRQQSVT
jgi:multiple sugar transport system ATP-binding protein